jgi:hypothetical protein
VRRLLVLAVALLAPAALRAPASADGKKAFEIPRRDVWRVGDVVTRTKLTDQDQKVVVTVQGTVVKEDPRRDVLRYTSVMRVEAVDDEGRVSGATVHFSAWSHQVNEETDESLTGAHVRLRGAAADRKVEIASTATKATDAARAWLESELGAVSLVREVERMEPFFPPGPVAEGDAWTPDLGKIRKALGAAVPFDPEKGSGSATVDSTDGGRVSWKSQISLATKGLPNPQGGVLPWTEGGTLEAKLQAERSLDASVHDARTAAVTEWKGKADAGGAVVEFTLETVTKTETQAGGTIPDLPKPDGGNGADAPPSK